MGDNQLFILNFKLTPGVYEWFRRGYLDAAGCICNERGYEGYAGDLLEGLGVDYEGVFGGTCCM